MECVGQLPENSIWAVIFWIFGNAKYNYAMKETPPNLPAENVYCVKQVCAEVGVTKTSLSKYRRQGLITPTNPGNPHRFKYTGQAVNELWHKLKKL